MWDLTVVRVVDEGGRGGLSTVRWSSARRGRRRGCRSRLRLEEGGSGWLGDDVREVQARAEGLWWIVEGEFFSEVLSGENRAMAMACAVLSVEREREAQNGVGVGFWR